MPDKETTRAPRGERGKLEPLIQRLKNTTGFHLQASSMNQKIKSLEQHWGWPATPRERADSDYGSDPTAETRDQERG
jgi:hypothetical protein